MHHFLFALVISCALAAWCAPACAMSPAPAPAASGVESLDVAISAADADIAAGRPADAVARLRPLMNAHPADRRLVLTLARAYVRLDDTGDAIDVLVAFVASHPADAEAQLVLAQAHAANRDYASSELDVRAALSATPNDPVALTALGEALALQRRDVEARAAYDAALRADPRSHTALVGRAWLEASSGAADRAAVDYRRALTLAPDDAEALDGLARVELTIDRPYAAHRLAARAVQAMPADAEGRELLAMAADRMRTRVAPFASFASAADARLADSGVDLSLGAIGPARGLLRFDELALGHDASNASISRVTAALVYPVDDHVIAGATISSTAYRVYGGFEIGGRWRRLGVRAGSSSAGIDAAADASDGRIYPAAALLATASTSAGATAALGAFMVDARALARSYGDGNRFSERSASVSHRIGGDAYARLTLSAGVRDGGFARNRSYYAGADNTGYYDYLHRRDRWLGFEVALAPPRTTARGGLLVDLGRRESTTIGGTTRATFERIAPYVDVGTDAMRLRAAAYRATYAGPAPYPGYASARLDLRADIRL